MRNICIAREFKKRVYIAFLYFATRSVACIVTFYVIRTAPRLKWPDSALRFLSRSFLHIFLHFDRKHGYSYGNNCVISFLVKISIQVKEMMSSVFSILILAD